MRPDSRGSRSLAQNGTPSTSLLRCNALQCRWQAVHASHYCQAVASNHENEDSSPSGIVYIKKPAFACERRINGRAPGAMLAAIGLTRLAVPSALTWYVERFPLPVLETKLWPAVMLISTEKSPRHFLLRRKTCLPSRRRLQSLRFSPQNRLGNAISGMRYCPHGPLHWCHPHHLRHTAEKPRWTGFWPMQLRAGRSKIASQAQPNPPF